MNETKKRIITSLSSVFIFIDENEVDNIDLSLYIEDSIQFISFIVALEDEFNIEIPDELLIFEKFRYLDDICTIINELI